MVIVLSHCWQLESLRSAVLSKSGQLPASTLSHSSRARWWCSATDKQRILPQGVKCQSPKGGVAGEAMERQGKSGAEALEQLQLTCTEERLGAALHIELAVEVVDVFLDRAEGNHQPVGDRLVRVTFRDQAQDFQLTLAERLH
jgi:hypothetical protein